MHNPYGCPDSVHRAMAKSPPGTMLAAIAMLGPARVQWIGSPPVRPTSMLTSWALDGARATPNQIFVAATQPTPNARSIGHAQPNPR